VYIIVLKASSRRRLGVHAPSTDLRLARLGARLARRPPYRLENNGVYRFGFGYLICFIIVYVCNLDVGSDDNKFAQSKYKLERLFYITYHHE